MKQNSLSPLKCKENLHIGYMCFLARALRRWRIRPARVAIRRGRIRATFFVRVGWTFMWVLDVVFETALHGVDEGVAAYARKAEGLST